MSLSLKPGQPVAGVNATGLDLKDDHGAMLADGHAVVPIKDWKIKGSSSAAKVGTKARAFDWWKAITTSTARSLASGSCS